MPQATPKRIRNARKSIALVVKILSGKDIPVYMKGSSAYVRWNTDTLQADFVCIPVIADDASDLFLDAIEGFVDHEVGHIIHTDPLATIEATEISATVNMIRNSIEDPRIETEQRKLFIGSAKNLNNLSALFLERFIDPEVNKLNEEGCEDPLTWFSVLGVVCSRSWFGQTAFQEYMDENNLWKNLGDIPDAVKHITDKFPSAKSNWDSLDLAGQLKIALFGKDSKDEDEDTASDGTKGKGDESSETKEGSTEDSEEETEDSEEETEDSEEETEDSEDYGDEESEEKGTPSESGDGAEAGDPDSGDVSIVLDPDREGELDIKDFDDAVSNVISVMAKESHDDSPYVPFATHHDYIGPYIMPDNYRETYYDEMKNAVNDMVGPMARKLERVFLSENKSRWQPGKRSGSLAAANLHRLVTNDDRVFRRKDTTRTKDVAVSLVVDFSGSMTGEKIHLACQAAWALAEVLNRIGISFEVIGFTTEGGYECKYTHPDTSDIETEWAAISPDRSSNPYNRVEQLVMPIISGFDEGFGTRQKRSLSAVPNDYKMLSCNVDGESIRYAGDRLLARREPGKTMIVLSDGRPSGSIAARGKPVMDHTCKVANDLEREGVNLIGIGIMDNTVEKFYRKSVVLNTIEDLPQQVLQQLSAAILMK